MIKRHICVIIIFVLCLAMVSCSETGAGTPSTESSSPETPAPEINVCEHLNRKPEFRTETEGLEECKENALLYVEICKDCGYEEFLESSDYHHTVTLSVDHAKYGFCEDHVLRYVECVCGKTKQFICENLYENSDSGESRLECEKCSISVKCDKERSSKNEKCEFVDHTKYTVTDGKETIGVYEDYSIVVSHNTNYSGELIDGASSCTDGVYIVGDCEDCDYHFENTFYFHHILYTNIDTTNKNVCADHNVRFRSCACKEKVNVEYNRLWTTEDENGEKVLYCMDCDLLVYTQSKPVTDDNGDEYPVIYEYKVYCKDTLLSSIKAAD